MFIKGKKILITAFSNIEPFQSASVTLNDDSVQDTEKLCTFVTFLSRVKSYQIKSVGRLNAVAKLVADAVLHES